MAARIGGPDRPTPRRGRRGRARRCATPLALALLATAGLAAQEPAEETGGQGLRVFLDCQDFSICDADFYRREIPYVNYTRDRADADVHVLVIGETTGAGGRRIRLDFIGRGPFETVDDRLELFTSPNTADEQVMTRVARRMQLGIARYIARTAQSDEVRLVPEAGPSEAVAAPEDDPWNFWTFRISGSGFYQGQERQNFLFGNAGVSANRITEGLKIELSVNGNYSESNFDVNDSTTVTSTTKGYSGGALAVWSLGERWAAGGQLFASHSTFSNEDLTLRIAPAVEYNLFPYAESTRRQLRFLYSVGVTRLDFHEQTVYFETETVVPDHRLAIALEVRQPWGSANGSLQVVQHLNDLERHRLAFDGGIELRIVRGLSINLSGGASRIRDQINIPAGDATEEEVLTRQRELETGFTYYTSFGLSYSFGSIFSNVVNPRIAGRNQFFLRGF